jgi:hypothetical protein
MRAAVELLNRRAEGEKRDAAGGLAVICVW